MAIKKGTKVYSEYFGNGVVDEIIDNSTIMVKFAGVLPESNYKHWCSLVLAVRERLAYNINLWYYKFINKIGHTPQHQLKIISKIKTIKE